MWKKVLMVAVAVSILLCGCGAKKETASSDDSISVLVFDRGLVAADEGTYEENRITKSINEKSGVNVKFVSVPRNQVQQKLNMMIASGLAPDVISDYDRTYVAKLVTEGAIMPVGDLIENHSTYYKKYLEENSDLKPYLTFDDQLYAFTSKRGQNSVANHGISIRKDWLDAKGLSMPETDEELLAVAKAFTEGDTYGMALSAAGIPIMDAIYQTSSIWYLEGDELEFGMVSPRKKDMLSFVNKLYTQGSIDKEFFADKNNAKAKQQWVSGKAGMYLSTYNATETKQLFQTDPTADVVPLKAVSTKYGRNGLWQEAPANMFVMINKDCKKPELAVKYLDWLLEEGWFEIMNGQENVHYKMVDGVAKVIDAEKSQKEYGYGISYTILNQHNVTPKTMLLQAADDEISQKTAKFNGDGMTVALSTPMRRDIPYDPPVQEFARLWAEFRPIVDEVVVNVMIGADGYTPESGYQKILDEWKLLDGDNVTKLVNEWYKENKDQLK